MTKLRDWALKWAGTVLFLVWEGSLRLRGKWRRSALRARFFGGAQ